MFAMLHACGQSKTATGAEKTSQPRQGYRSAKHLEVDGLQFKDLTRNGQSGKYEDWRLTPAERSQDLLNRMTLEEKVGQLSKAANTHTGG
jgi:beta-glucosidase